MSNSINKLAISNFLGIDVLYDNIRSSNIAIPAEAAKPRDDKMKEYRKAIKENRHASVKDKVKDTFKKGTLSEDEEKRRENLRKAFIDIKEWMNGMDTFFWNCKGDDIVEKYLKEINKEYKAFKKKGYLEEIDYKDFPKFDNKDYILDKKEEKYKGGTYGFQIKTIYRKELYEKFEELLKDYNSKFEDTLKRAKDTQKVYTDNFDDMVSQIDDYLEKYEDLYLEVQDLIREYNDPKNIKLKREKRKFEDAYKEVLGETNRALKKAKDCRWEALFAHVYKDESVPQSTKESVLNHAQKLNSFCNLATGTHNSPCRFKKLAKMYSEIGPHLEKKVKPALEKFVDPKQPASKATSNNIVRYIKRLTYKTRDNQEKLEAAQRLFDSKMEDYRDKVDELKKEAAERKMKVRIYAIVAVASLVITAFKAFFPIIDAALSVEDTPVEGAPQI